MRPPEDMHQLMRRIEEYKRLENDRLQRKGKAPSSSQYRKEYRPDKFQQRPEKEPRASKEGLASRAEEVNMAFKKPVYKILECIKNEPYFRWVGKMGGDLARRNQSLYCTYHWEKGHTTEQCRVLKDHLKQLVKVGHLKEFIVGQEGGNVGQGSRS